LLPELRAGLGGQEQAHGHTDGRAGGCGAQQPQYKTAATWTFNLDLVHFTHDDLLMLFAAAV
jgi:hypothetical protein